MNLLERAARIAAAARVAEDADRARARVLAELVGGQPGPGEGADQARQLAALLELSRDRERTDMTLAGALARLTETATDVLRIQRAGVWFFNHDASALECADLYDTATAAHSREAVLYRHDFPIYFATLATTRVLDVADANHDPRTREFSAIYFRRRGIASTLDAPIRWRGGLHGVLCCEHVGEPRTWTDEEQTFVASLADAATLALETDRRRTIERELLHRLSRVEAQREAIARVSLPVLEVWDGIVAVPVIGALDGERLSAILSLLPEAVSRRGTGWVLLDLTAAEPLDARAADGLVQIAAAVRRLGAGCVLSGVPAEVAGQLCGHNHSLARVPTAPSLKAALGRCLHAYGGSSSSEQAAAR